MRHLSLAVGVSVLAALASTAGRTIVRAQAQETVDFARDVQPLLTERCVGCHGPTQQQGGYRLDRKSGALGGQIRKNINAGNSGSSRMFLRISSTYLGPQMPPTGALSAAEIDQVKRWIDQGAEWPDALANEADVPPVDAAAADLIRSITDGPLNSLPSLAALKAIVNTRGPGGSTPLMYAALYGDARLVEAMLAAGADPNLANNAGATALMWSLEDQAMAMRLLDAGADVNASSTFGRNALALAAAQINGTALVKLLLDRGATASGAAGAGSRRGGAGGSPALVAAATRGDLESVRLLLNAGARDTGQAAAFALRANCKACYDAILAAQPELSLRTAFNSLLPPNGAVGADMLAAMFAHGVDVTARDDKGRPVLMRAALNDAATPDMLQMLIDKGADVNATDADGLTALDFARRDNRPEIVDLLRRNGATGSSVNAPRPEFVKNNDARAAIARSLPLLQRTSEGFYAKAGCISCHHNLLTQLTVATARTHSVAVDDASARANLTPLVRDIEAMTDQALQGIVIFGGAATTTGYTLMALSSSGHQPDLATDAVVRLLRLSQRADGRWGSTYRPPSEASEFTATAVSVRGIQSYGTPRFRAANDRAISAAAQWLASAAPRTGEDHAFRVFGLTWAKADESITRTAIRELIALQRPDGGWAQLPSLASDAYSTGQSLIALAGAGMPPTDPIYRRGVRYLLDTQLADGSWQVTSRSHATQAYFETGFPHSSNQFISAAATNWATQAIILGNQN